MSERTSDVPTGASPLNQTIFSSTRSRVTKYVATCAHGRENSPYRASVVQPEKIDSRYHFLAAIRRLIDDQDCHEMVVAPHESHYE